MRAKLLLFYNNFGVVYDFLLKNFRLRRNFSIKLCNVRIIYAKKFAAAAGTVTFIRIAINIDAFLLFVVKIVRILPQIFKKVRNLKVRQKHVHKYTEKYSESVPSAMQKAKKVREIWSKVRDIDFGKLVATL